MQKLMDVFSLYEEEQVLPKRNVLRYAAKVLESEGHDVPFKVPPVCCCFLTFSFFCIIKSFFPDMGLEEGMRVHSGQKIDGISLALLTEFLK